MRAILLLHPLIAQMLRLLFFALIVIVVITSVIGVNSSCSLVLGGHDDACRAGQTETLAQHLAHATNTFPELFLISILALVSGAALVTTLFSRTAFLPLRDVQLSPEQPPRFA